MEIKNLEKRDQRQVKEIVDIHMKTFTGFFLTFMGKGFLKCMYKSYLDHKDSSIIVACDGDKISGFLAYSTNQSGLYKYMIKRRLIPFAWYSFCAFLRKPKVFLRLIRAFLKPSETSREENYVELASIGVSPEFKSKGIGSLLITSLKQQVDFTKYNYITLETDAVDNEPAIKFYKKNQFKCEREFETREGRRMLEFRFTKSE